MAKVKKSEALAPTAQSAHCAGLFMLDSVQATIQERMKAQELRPLFLALPAKSATVNHDGKLLANNAYSSHPFDAKCRNTMAPAQVNVRRAMDKANPYPTDGAFDGWTPRPYLHLVAVQHAIYEALRAAGTMTLAAIKALPEVTKAKYGLDCARDTILALRAFHLAFTSCEAMHDDTIVTLAAIDPALYVAGWPQAK